jgi:uncharacterized pyridoxamine 5'-phosphate oxidase family protein
VFHIFCWVLTAVAVTSLVGNVLMLRSFTGTMNFDDGQFVNKRGMECGYVLENIYNTKRL